MVERLVANEKAAGSIPVSRSTELSSVSASWQTLSVCHGNSLIQLSEVIDPLSGSRNTMIEFLEQYHRVVLGLHIFGIVLGFGGAIMSDIFFFKFLKDFRISKQEADTFRTLSKIIWVGVALLVMSGIGLYLPHAETLNASSKFLLKMVVVAIIIINGVCLNLFVAPKLIKISFGEKHEHMSGELRRSRRLAYALGAVSLTSWTSAFLLGMARSIPLSFPILLGIYLLLLLGAITTSQIIEQVIVKRASHS